MKAKGGKLSTLQEVWLKKMSSVGYKAEVCFGYDHAVHGIVSYLNK